METVSIAPSLQTTIRIPNALYEQVKRMVQCGASASVNEFIIEAMSERVRQLWPGAMEGKSERVGDDSCGGPAPQRPFNESTRCGF